MKDFTVSVPGSGVPSDAPRVLPSDPYSFGYRNKHLVLCSSPILETLVDQVLPSQTLSGSGGFRPCDHPSGHCPVSPSYRNSRKPPRTHLRPFGLSEPRPLSAPYARPEQPRPGQVQVALDEGKRRRYQPQVPQLPVEFEMDLRGSWGWSILLGFRTEEFPVGLGWYRWRIGPGTGLRSDCVQGFPGT